MYVPGSFAMSDPAELHANWLDMFDRWDEMFDLASGLMASHRVYLLSNVGDLHWAHFERLYGLDSLVHGACASFRVGALKPEASIYRRAEAIQDASRQGVSGQRVTPFVLAYLHERSGGRTREVNRALATANARLAGEVAVAFAGL